MAKKQPIEDRDVLKFKLQALQDYISHYEQRFDQFRIDLDKANLFRDPTDPGGFARRVKEIIFDLYTAAPPQSLFNADLADSRAELNASPEWAEFRRQLVKDGLAMGPIESGFDSALLSAIKPVFDGLNILQSTELSAKDCDEFARELLAIMGGTCVVLDAALGPARHLRQKWHDVLNSRTSTRPRKRGRPKSQDIIERNQKMKEAWETGQYKTYAELATEFKVEPDTARKAVRQTSRKSKADY